MNKKFMEHGWFPDRFSHPKSFQDSNLDFGVIDLGNSHFNNNEIPIIVKLASS